ncbi:MAG TPA: efflux RND transporter periplasmic adaptor subunit [Tepidisphaeraceae bacterium]|nr:efflux RND transporter periplasmic adaptor subunit [Tepidisphaeraceae bacterium]
METMTKPPRTPRRDEPIEIISALEGHEEIPTVQSLPRPRRAVLLLIGVALLIVLGVAFAAGIGPRLHRTAQFNAEAEAIANEIPAVAVDFPTRTQASTRIALPGSMQALQETAIFARTTGYLKKWYDDYGAHVKAGDLLAEIDAPDVDEQLSQSRATLESDQANLAKSDLDLTYNDVTAKRYDSLMKSNSATPQELDMYHANLAKARTAVSMARANVAADAANVKRLEDLQSFEKITAPFSGTITARNYDVGALITANGTSGIQPMFRIAQTDVLRVWVNVPQAFSTLVRPGLTAELKVREYPGKTFAAKVAHTAGALDTATRTLLTEVQVPNPDGKLLAGMYCEVSFDVTDPSPPLIIPVGALITQGQGNQVAVVDADGVARYKTVQLGRDSGTTVEVVAGLDRHDRVVTNPGERLSDGVKVRIINEPTAKN